MNKLLDEKFMRIAIIKAESGIKKGQTPFGAAVVRNKKVISCAHNAVWKNTDITAHAEIQAIKQACRRLKTIDLSGCTVYSTCEPCPMCFSACHWARVSEIVYGAKIQDAKRYGFNELAISNKSMKQSGRSKIKLTGNFLREENLKLFQLWSQCKDKRVY